MTWASLKNSSKRKVCHFRQNQQECCRLLKQEELAILSAREVVAMNQDPLGVAGDLIWKQGSKEVPPPSRHLCLDALYVNFCRSNHSRANST